MYFISKQIASAININVASVFKHRIWMLFCFFSIATVSNSQDIKDLIGYWKSCDEDDNMVVSVKLNEKNMPVGYLVGFQRDDGTWEENKPKKGLKVMYDFEYAGDLKWNNGKIYDPIAERTYKGVVRLQSKDTIKAIGYWAFLWDDIFFRRIKLKESDVQNN